MKYQHLSPEQRKCLTLQIKNREFYFRKLTGRMRQLRWADSDSFLQAADKARAAMEELLKIVEAANEALGESRI